MSRGEIEIRQAVYNMFGELYYEEAFRPYTDNEVSVTEAGQCLAKSFFQRKVHRAMMDSKIIILSFGKLIHGALEHSLKSRGYETEAEGKHTVGDVTLYGHADAVCNDHILEFKTISRMPYSPLSHHYVQINAYMYIFSKPLGYVVYIHKPSGLAKVFETKRDDDMFKYVVARAVRLSHALRKSTIPTAEPSWLCNYCEYRDICPTPAPETKDRMM